MLGELDANRADAVEIDILNVRRRRFKYYLKLEVLIEAVWIFAIAAIGGTAARLHVGDAIRLRTEHAKKCLRVHRAGADLDIIWLLKNAVAVGPEFLKFQYKILKRWAD